MKNKESKNLRRQVEVLKAQLNSSKFQSGESKHSNSFNPIKKGSVVGTEIKNTNGQVKFLKDDSEKTSPLSLNIKEIKKDIYKTVGFLAFSSVVIVLLTIIQDKWVNFLKF